MKRGTPHHPKTALLAEMLNIPTYSAIGLLECLFHFTARYSPRGDVGRFPDSAIAHACFWAGESKSFIEALIQCRWIDRQTENRLVVHDWHAHADNTVRTALTRDGATFWNGKPPRRTGLESDTAADASMLQQRCDPVSAFLAKPMPSPAIVEGSLSPAGELCAGGGPSLEEVCEFSASIGVSGTEAENFCSYYITRGWCTAGGQPIRSWRAALQRWKTTSRERPGSHRPTCNGNRKPTSIDYADPNDPLLGRRRGTA